MRLNELGDIKQLSHSTRSSSTCASRNVLTASYRVALRTILLLLPQFGFDT